MRNEVKIFAEAMEETLKENDYKGGWNSCSVDYLQKKLFEEVAEYCRASKLSITSAIMMLIGEYNNSYPNGHTVKKETVDIGNICMMLYDRTFHK